MGLEKVEALQNLVVLDLTRVVAGPYAGSILGDFGAEVIKIEVPGKGDDARSYGPATTRVKSRTTKFCSASTFSNPIRSHLRSPYNSSSFT